MTLRAKCHEEHKKRTVTREAWMAGRHHSPEQVWFTSWLSHYHLHTLKNRLRFNCCTKFLKRSEERASPAGKGRGGCSTWPGEGSASRLAMVAAEPQRRRCSWLLAPQRSWGGRHRCWAAPRQGGWLLQSALRRSLRPRQGRAGRYTRRHRGAA